MKTTLRAVTFFLGCCLLFPGSVIGDDACGEWEEARSGSGIKAYTREVPDSQVFDLRAVTVIPCRLEVVTEILRDVDAHHEWRPFCKEARKVRQPDQFSMLVYDVTDMPFPFKDRDAVLDCKIELQNEIARAVAHLNPTTDPEIPETEKRLRMTDMYVSYVLQYISENKTRVVFTCRVDLGGNMPDFIKNFGNRMYAFMSLKALRKQVKEQKYIERAKNAEDRNLIDQITGDPGKRKTVYKNQLKVFIKNNDFVDMIMDDGEMVEHVFEGEDSGRIGEIMLYGWGSTDSQREAVKALVADLMTIKGKSKEQIKDAIRNEDLITWILTGDKPSSCSAPQQNLEDWII